MIHYFFLSRDFEVLVFDKIEREMVFTDLFGKELSAEKNNVRSYFNHMAIFIEVLIN